ncbi:cell division protein SufI [Glycomyces sambucus]|uniref:Cell division protein SufI n=1 Tax=Glycomyces sambucus TaxID=380244 RepID=A0A1G9CND7_9ACTN|nr:multicopper oxidase domain-containing protein [Glycomyces sambucus]SDK53099.1 cell division protein SufI [Glycomyces sambucus]
MRRRKAIGLTIGIGSGALVLGSTGAFALHLATAGLDTVGEVDFDRPLALPPLAPSTEDPSSAKVFHLEIQSGQMQFTDGGPTDTWGVNGAFLGPTLRAKRGQEIAFAVRNGLDEATSLHWHGMHLPAVMDGGPHQEVRPGETWTPQWTVDQPAATLWYHPHPHGRTAAHLLRGLAGMFIVDDDGSEALRLPQTYGVDDVPMIVQDRKFDGDDQFDDAATLFGALGVTGDRLLVNGTVGPYFDVTTRLVRLRLLNASGARMYHFGFSDDRTFSLIATDGGLLPEAWETDRIQLSPGERAEIVVAFEPGETVDLRSYPTDIGGVMGRLDGFADRLDVCRFRAGEALADDTEIPAVMGTAPDIDAGAAAVERSFTLGGDAVNGEAMSMERIDFGVRVDTVEVWGVVNDNGFLHNFHVHDVQFQVLEVAGEEPPPHLRGWKDTVPLLPGEPNRLALRFTGYTDPNMPYMFHCHVLQHEDDGMMGQFVVLGEGEEIGTVAAASAHDHS